MLRARGAADGAALRLLLARAPAEHLASGGDPVILAWDGERVVAAAALERRVPEVAFLSMAIDPGYRGRRLGTWLLLDLVHLAAGLGIERLETALHPGDAAYRAALERLDFVVDAAQASPSSIVLAKRLHRAWTDF